MVYVLWNKLILFIIGGNLFDLLGNIIFNWMFLSIDFYLNNINYVGVFYMY